MINIQSIHNGYSTIKCGTAFSGVGAFEQAMKNLNLPHTNCFMVEIDAFARQTFLANHAVNRVYKDVTTLDPSTLESVDIFVFGSPCQSFSIQGKRGGFEDTRGTLVFYGLNIIQEKQPKYFIFENVKGMLNHDKGKTFAVIQSAFEELNYTIKYSVLNSRDFGNPQNRERLFVVCIRNDIAQTFVFPKANIAMPCLNDYIQKGPIDKRLLCKTDNIVLCQKESKSPIKKVAEYAHISFKSDKHIFSTQGIAPCFRAGGRNTFFDTKNSVYRHLSVEEMAKVQGFDNFVFPVSNSQAYKQIGNSITVNVLEAILKNLLCAQMPANIIIDTMNKEVAA